MLGVPLLLLVEIVIPEETTRLLAFGAILASAFAIAITRDGEALQDNQRESEPHPNPLPMAMNPPWGEGTREVQISREVETPRAFSPPQRGEGAQRADEGSPSRQNGPVDLPHSWRARLSPAPDSEGTRPHSVLAMLTVAVLALIVLRWIPFEDVLLGRELFLLAIAVALVAVLGFTPFAVIVAVVTVFVTPAVPLRTLAFPLVVLFIAVLARLFGLPRLRLTWVASLALGLVILFFPWSGIVARAFPYFLRKPATPAQRTVVDNALGPSRAMTYDVPHGARWIVLSGANVAHLRRGEALGSIEPGGVAIRVGDAADWGYLRRDQFHRAHNPLPRDAAGTIRGYGYQAWMDGAGRVALPRGTRRIRVTAAPTLPADAALQVEGFE